ncbi:MAG: OsmC family protein [Polyangiaceae bacterium]|nr:OsmC family protein [Polyangiaceae bacterium]
MIVNGVDVDKLGGMVAAVKQDPKLATLRFSMHSEWKGGLKAEHFGGQYKVGVTSAQHKQRRSVLTDEPPEILGSDAGVSPAEMTLAALASCLMVGYAANAAAMGIELESVTLDLTGDGDLQGFMNLGGVRPGLSRISVTAQIKSRAPREKLKELHDYVNAHSPIWDTLANPVKVDSTLVDGRPS